MSIRTIFSCCIFSSICVANLSCTNNIGGENSDWCYLYPIEENGLVGFIDGRGVERVSPQYDRCGTIDRNQTLYARKDSTWSKISITSSGELTTEALPFTVGAESIIDVGDGLYTLYYKGTEDSPKGHFATCDTKHVFIGDAAQKKHEFRGLLLEGLLRFWDPVKQKCGVADRNGNTVIPAEKYTYIGNFHEGVALVYVMLDGHRVWGFVDHQGNEIIPPKYRGAGPFSSGMASVGNEEGWFHIRKDGSRAFGDAMYAAAGSFTCERATIRPFDYPFFGFIDTSGEVVIPAIYHSGGIFRDGLVFVSLTPLNEIHARTRCIDIHGKTIYEGDYRVCDDYRGPLAQVIGVDFGGYINRNNGRIVWKQKKRE